MKPLFKPPLLGVVVCVALGGTASAQEAIVEGPGIPLGEGAVFHPAVSVESGYVSNVFYEDEDPVGSAMLRVIGAFSLASQTHELATEITPAVENEGEEIEEPPPPAKVDFRLGGQLILNGYLSDNEAVSDQTDVGVALDGSVIFNPHGDIAAQVDDTFLRDTRPHNFESTGNLNRDYNHALASLTFQPQGRTISVGARYENTIDRFESNDAAFANRLQHLVGLRGDWRLFPYTKFFLDTSLGFFGGLDSEATGFKSDSMPLRIQGGVGTALTEVTTIRAYIGYGNGFYDQGQNFSNVIGGAEFGYRYTEYGRLVLTADYNFHDSLQANFYRDYSLLANLSQQVGLIVLSADAGLRIRGYRGIPTSLGGTDSRDDVIFATGLQVAYLLRDWLGITARGQATIDSTDYEYMAGSRTVSPAYQRYEAFLGVTAAF